MRQENAGNQRAHKQTAHDEPSVGRELAVLQRLDKNSIAIPSKTGGRSRR